MNSDLINCKACGKEIGESVKKCIHCGTDQRNFFLRHKIITFFLIMFVLSVIDRTAENIHNSNSKQTIASVASSNDTVKPAESNSDSIKVTAEDLLNAYDSNEVKADLMYKGKLVDVTGIVTDIRVTFGKTAVSLSNEEGSGLKDVTCYFDDKSQDLKVADLKKGDKVTISGVVNGKLFLGVGVDNSTVKQTF